MSQSAFFEIEIKFEFRNFRVSGSAKQTEYSKFKFVALLRRRVTIKSSRICICVHNSSVKLRFFLQQRCAFAAILFCFFCNKANYYCIL